MTELKTLATYLNSHRSNPVAVDCDLLSDLILAVTNHPEYDEDDAVACCVIDDAALLFSRAEDAQEAAEIEWEMAANNPDHPRHLEVWAELNATKPTATKPDPVKAAMSDWVDNQDPEKLKDVSKSLETFLNSINPDNKGE